MMISIKIELKSYTLLTFDLYYASLMSIEYLKVCRRFHFTQKYESVMKLDSYWQQMSPSSANF